MLIKSITLNNFRQFKGKQILEFSTDTDKNVTVLLGDNTFGKTTILVKSRLSVSSDSFRLLNIKPRHQPVELLPCDGLNLRLITGPTVSSPDNIQPFI